MGIAINGATPVLEEPDKFYQIDVDKYRSKNNIPDQGSHGYAFAWVGYSNG